MSPPTPGPVDSEDIHSGGSPCDSEQVGPWQGWRIEARDANVPEFIILTRLVKAHLVTVLFVYIFTIAVAGGLLAESLD